MDEIKKTLAIQLRDSLLEHFISIKAFCEVNNCRYSTVTRFLNGESRKFDETLYNHIRDRIETTRTVLRSDVVLFQTIAAKYFESHHKLCKMLHINFKTYLQNIERPDSLAFKKMALQVYSYVLTNCIEETKVPVQETPMSKHLRIKKYRRQHIRERVMGGRMKYDELTVEERKNISLAEAKKLFPVGS